MPATEADPFDLWNTVDRWNLWEDVARECPRKLDCYRHRAGLWTHWLTPNNTLVCLHKDDLVPEASIPTTKQARAWKGDL